ncbi:acetyl-CoA synthetase-like protein [Aspergillus ellipticus CBS 707.79]|uniref:Acetyl-CoA synthetase-like protein n=1 Tax=Aspergillus ellipticus CBS 707.79 TaxID=1448320 RepID=A0A319EAW7_9EURO|nr:acetyl-CoA synthetase-like protein [Aspergillus ellipticus CBS 707.79]
MGDVAFPSTILGYPRAWERFDHVVKRQPDHPALVCVHQKPGLYGLGVENRHGHAQWTYRDLAAGITRLADGLIHQGISEESLVFVALGNSLEHVLTTWAAYRLGATHVSIQPQSLSNSVEARHVFQKVLDNQPSRTVAVVVQNDVAAQKFNDLFPDLDLVKIAVEDASSGWTPFGQLLQPQQNPPSNPPRRTGSSSPETSIFFSSGTTSLPKPCLMNVPAWLSSLASGSTLGAFAAGDRVMSLVPCSHVFGYIGQMFALTQGATLVYPFYMSFAPQATMKMLQEESYKYMIMVSTLAHVFITADPLQFVSPLDTVIFSGMTLATAVAQKFQARVGTRAIENIYGMTEGAFCSTGRVEQIDDISSDGFLAVGQPMARSQVHICAPDSIKPLPPGIAGEVHYSGYQTARGYIGIPSDAFYTDRDGKYWYKTGDQAILNASDGLLYPVGRYKDLIIRGGKNISPSAIEAVLSSNPELYRLNPQAVPRADAVAGEVPVIIVNQPLQSGQAQQITSMIQSKMGSGYAPDEVLSIQTLGQDDYPRTTSGKVQKVQLAALVREYDQTLTTSDPIELVDIDHRIAEVWADVLGITPSELDLNGRVADWAGSITSMRVHFKMTNNTGKDIPFATWIAAKTISDQILLLKSAATKQVQKVAEVNALSIPQRAGGPEINEIVHLVGDASRLPATKALVEATIASCGLTWDDVGDILPATDFQHLMRQAQLIEGWQFFVSIHTRDTTSQQLRRALEATLANHPLLLSFAIIDDTNTLQVTVKPSPRILDRCIVDYGTVDTMEDVRQLTMNFPPEHRMQFPGPLFGSLIVHVKEINSAVLVAHFCHSIVDSFHHTLFTHDLDLALSGQPLDQHTPYKAWADSYYLLQDSLAAKPALSYYIEQMRPLQNQPYALWPAPSSYNLSVSPECANDHLHFLEFSVPALQTLRSKHPDLTPLIVLKTALSLLTVFHTKHPNVLLLNLESARRQFPFLLPSITSHSGRLLDGSRVAGPTLTGSVELIPYHSHETVLELLYRLQDQQHLLTQHANAPWRQIMKHLPFMRELFPQVANHLIFNWTGSSTFKPDAKKLPKYVAGEEIWFRATAGLAVDAGCKGKDGTELCVTMSGAIVNGSKDDLRDISEGFRRIATWLAQPENWDREAGLYREALGLGW